MSSDVAIAQFRFLERLLLVHGHWCYRRISSMVMYLGCAPLHIICTLITIKRILVFNWMLAVLVLDQFIQMYKSCFCHIASTSNFLNHHLIWFIYSFLQICYFFYKNVTFGFTVFLYEAYASFSAQPAYNDWFLTLYNIFFTSLPAIALGVFDQDVSARFCLKVCLSTKAMFVTEIGTFSL